MKAIMVMFDSLNRHMLPPYGCDWVHAPNFQRLAQKAVTFDTSYVGSMPCMPARREIHTGRYNFLHRSWGPVEPYDDSMPEILKKNGVYTHLVSDHYHYWEEGGCNYHTRYSTWEISRGQEGDPWIGQVKPEEPESGAVGRNALSERWHMQDRINRKFMPDEEDHYQARTFARGLDFIERNREDDNWFLQIETFDPHEPYFVPKKYKDLYDFDFDKCHHHDWPPYARVTDEDRQYVEHMRYTNAALISMCDAYLGKVLDMMDAHGMWQDTMLIVNTDHGFLLGEHDWWAKCAMPYYEEISHTPFFVWDPRCGISGERRKSLVQTIDIGPTLLEFFGVDIPEDAQGKPLRDTIATDAPVREAGLFGMFGAHVNVTDGRYVYMRAPATEENTPLFEYTHMPTHMRHTFWVDEMQGLQELSEPFSFTKGCRLMKIPTRPGRRRKENRDTMLFDLADDPKQLNPIDDTAVEERMIEHLVRLMKENDAPEEQFERLGLA